MMIAHWTSHVTAGLVVILAHFELLVATMLFVVWYFIGHAANVRNATLENLTFSVESILVVPVQVLWNRLLEKNAQSIRIVQNHFIVMLVNAPHPVVTHLCVRPMKNVWPETIRHSANANLNMSSHPMGISLVRRDKSLVGLILNVQPIWVVSMVYVQVHVNQELVQLEKLARF